MSASQKRKYALSLLVLALFWLGFLAGVSFLATPVKFLAPSLTLPVALDVGRQTFAILNPMELLFVILLSGVAALAWRSTGPGRVTLAMTVVLLLLVLAQMLWLLPVLDARVEVILQGGTPPASRLHLLYIVMDVVKLLILGVVAVKQVQDLR